MRHVLLIGALTGCLLLPAAAGAEVLYDQTDNAAPPSADPSALNFSPSNEFGAGDGDRTADDFVVPPGEAWRIKTIHVAGAYQVASDPGAAVNAYIYPDAGGEPGFALFEQLGITAPGGPNYDVPVTGTPRLGPGTYWVTIQQANAADGYWSWGTRPVKSGTAAQWFSSGPEPGPEEGCDTPGWNPRRLCWPSSNPDQTFQLDGRGKDMTKIKDRPDNRIERGRAKYRFVSALPDSTFECRLRGNGLSDKVRRFRPCQSPKRYKGLDPGRYRFAVRATDAKGNMDPTPAKDKFKVLE